MFDELKKRLRKKQESEPSQPAPTEKKPDLFEKAASHETPEMLEERKKKEEEFRRRRNNPFGN